MKKLIVPVLMCVVALTSCSKALYKDKYDWVKVDRTETSISRAEVSVESSFDVQVTRSLEDTLIVQEETASKQAPSTCEAAQEMKIVPPDTLSKSRTNREVKKTQKENRVSTGYLTIDPNWKISGKRNSSNMSTEEKGYLIAGIVLVVLLLVLLATVGLNPVVNGILLLFYLVKSIAAIVAAVLMIAGIYLLLKGFITMMDH